MQTAKWRGVVVAGVMMALVGAPMVAGVAFAAGNKHQAEAVEHAKEAVAHGKHAEAALKHAEGAVAETKNPHVTEAIKGLKDGIEHGKAGHADVATKAVENALPHLSEGM